LPYQGPWEIYDSIGATRAKQVVPGCRSSGAHPEFISYWLPPLTEASYYISSKGWGPWETQNSHSRSLPDHTARLLDARTAIPLSQLHWPGEYACRWRRAKGPKWQCHKGATASYGGDAHADAGTREQCLGVGMDDYISKPASRSTIQKMLSKWNP
jgi:hypothetical protein